MIQVLKQSYRVMLIEAALTVSLAHGSNDVANSIAPLLVEMKVNGVKDEWAFWVGGLGIALGLLTLGYKVIQVVGKEVIVLDFYKGFSCQFATANCIILGSKFGIPLSTTHCMVGSLFGIILSNKIPMVRAAYANLKENSLFEQEKTKSIPEQSVDSETASLDGPAIGMEESEAKVKDENSVNLQTVKKILFFWGLTVPASLGLSWVITALLLIKLN